MLLSFDMEKMMGTISNKRKKICILSNGLFRGGTDTFVVNLVKGLDKEKYDVTVVLSISDSWLAVREEEVLDVGAKTIWTCDVNNGLKGQLKHLVKLFKILKKEKFDVFQTNIDLFNGYNLFVAWLARVPIRICHSHNSRQELEVAGGRNVIISIYQWIMRRMCWRFSNRRCGCSELALDFLFEDKWKKDPRAIVVNNGIEINDFRNGISKNKKKTELNIDLNKKCVLTVGRLSTQKNPMMIAEIFGELCKKRDDCDLIWVGIGEMEEQLKKRIEELGVSKRVHFLGTRSDVNELMQCCDVFLFPSLFEGLGIVLIEAQSAGLPCLVSDVVPNCVNCGGCTFLDLSMNSEKWAVTLSDILDGRCDLVVNEAALNQYSISTMVKQMESLFE